MIDEHVPKGARVLAVNGVPDSYTSHEVLVTFQAGFNEDLGDILDAGWDESRQPLRRRIFKFTARPARRMRVLQTGEGGPLEEFKVTELRYFFQGAELPRDPAWRLKAWPNPWDVQMAFDNSPVTRWRSWEVAAPGMFIETDFGKYEQVDQVAIETSPDYLNIRLQVDAMDQAGKWVKVAFEPHDDAIPAPVDIRRYSGREFHERGIDYILMNDTDWGAEDMREDPGSWGLKEIAKGFGARIYKVVVE
jgi:hypothetical protein